MKVFLTSLLLIVVAASGCKTTEDGKAMPARELPPAPQVTADMPLDKAIAAALDYGGDTLQSVKAAVKKRGDGEKAGKILEKDLQSNVNSYEHNQLINAGALYSAMPVPVSTEVFHLLIQSQRPLARQLGWQLAAVKPSAVLAAAIDKELTRAVVEGEDETVLIPQAANAVRANHLTSAYTLMRQGLMSKGDEEYALTMMSLDPQRSSDDFLAYLAIAPAEELRQLTLASVNLYTCVSILRHMQVNPPTPATTGFDELFVYAVSRNTALAELAQNVIEAYLPQQTGLMAQSLARLPAWIQIAYLDNAKRRMNSKQGLLFSELRKTTADTDVQQEIDETKF